MFTLFCIFNVIWHALNGFSFQLLIYAISAIKNICIAEIESFLEKINFSKKETIYLLILRYLSYVLLYIWYCSLKIKSR